MLNKTQEQTQIDEFVSSLFANNSRPMERFGLNAQCVQRLEKQVPQLVIKAEVKPSPAVSYA